MESNRWIVVGCDFSEGAARALEQAIDLAGKVGASVKCVHAYEDATGTPLREDRAPALLRQLEEMIARSRAATLGVRAEPCVRRGPAWEKLLNVACELGAHFIVVGATGERQGQRPQFIGTVASRLAVISTRMVLIVPCGMQMASASEQRGAA